MKKLLLFFAALLSCQMMSAAKVTMNELTSYQVGDTILFFEDHQAGHAKKAKKAKKQKVVSYGVVKSIDEDNVANIEIFDNEDNTLKAIHSCIASGEDFGKRQGKQTYFYPDGKVEKVDVYSLTRHEKSGKNRSVQLSETLFYPDGTEQEKVILTFSGDERHESYDRKGYYPNGALQFREIGNNESYSVTFYDEAGDKVTETPDGYSCYMTMPVFPGGQDELFYFLSHSVRYPAECQKSGIQGRVICSFVVAEDGKIEGVEVLRSGGHPLLNSEAVRVIRSMPRWTPGTKRGKPVRVRYTLPVTFRLQ